LVGLKLTTIGLYSGHAKIFSEALCFLLRAFPRASITIDS
jgi:hypothetical protein